MEGEMKLFGFKYSWSVQEVMAAAYFAGVNLYHENVDLEDETTRAILKKQIPTATFPYLQTPNGNICQCEAIMQYLAELNNPALLGNNAWERAEVDQWSNFGQWEIYKYSEDAFSYLFGWSEYNKEKADAAVKHVKEWLKVLDNHLNGKTYVVGNNYTLADLNLFVYLRPYFQFLFVDEVRKSQFPNVTSWFQGLISNEHIIKAFGRIFLCKTPQKPPRLEATKEVKKEEKKPEKPSEKPKAAEGEEEEKSTKKKANPLDLLPPSPFVLDEFKREFMNSKDRPAVMKDFWTKFDANGYSLWTMKYDKLPSEGKILFRTKNSLSFFLQKLDQFRKYSFSAHGIYGVEGDYDIKGCWMWRGNEIPEEVKQHESYEYMLIKKLDSSKEEDRLLVESYWLNLEEGLVVDGQPTAYVETFK